MEKVLLSFKNVGIGKGEASLDFKTATTNIAVFGGTGVGKTTSVCYPIISKMICERFSGLVLDIKGDYTNLIRLYKNNEKYKDNFITLGVKSHCDEVNIINGISPEKLKMFISDIISGFNDLSNNSYWGMNGIEDTILIYKILIYKQIQPNLADLYYYLVKNDKLEGLCEKVNHKIKGLINDRVSTDNFSVFNFEITETTASEQRTWQLSKILNFLKPFYENHHLRKYFYGEDNIDYYDCIYNKNKIFSIDLPIYEYDKTAIFIFKIIKSIYIDTIRSVGSDNLKNLGYGENKFTFLLIDEYQQFINKCSTASMDDNNWFDTSRGYGHINIISTQSVDSLISKSDYNYTQQLLGNTRNIIHMSTNSKHSLEHIQMLSNENVKNKLLFQKEDCAYFYVGKFSETRLGFNDFIITGKSKHLHMNQFIKKKIPFYISKKIEVDEIEEYRETYIQIFDIEDYKNSNDNIWERNNKNKIKKINKNLKIITSFSQSEGFKDFNFICNKLGLYFNSVDVYSIIYKNNLSLEFYDHQDAKDIFTDNSLILYIRGGGNMNDCFLNQKEHIKKIKNLSSNTESLVIGIGYGHIGDEFDLVEDQTIKIHSITPTELAYDLNRFY